MDDPFAALVDGGRLYGRGSYDMKAALAAAMLAGAAAASLHLDGDVVVAAVADEELDSIGTAALLEHVTTDAAIVCEPTELRVATAHRGFAAFEIETTGVAAHGSMPELGDDAIVKMGPILSALADLDARLAQTGTHALLPPPSVHASLISGGQDLFSYAARCILGGERRTVPGESRDDVERELRELVESAGQVGVEVRMLVGRDPFEVEAGAAVVQAVLAAADETEVVGLPFWTDAGLIAAAGVPTVLFGPAGTGAHAAVEWVDLASAERCRDVYLATARAFCA
jgi:acetylornithine deacetylase